MTTEFEFPQEIYAPELEEQAVQFFEALQEKASNGQKEAGAHYGPADLTVGLAPSR